MTAKEIRKKWLGKDKLDFDLNRKIGLLYEIAVEIAAQLADLNEKSANHE